MAQSPGNLSDLELIKIYRQNGDKNTVGELFKRHSLMCFTVCNKYLKNEEDAFDAAMNVFEKLFEDIKKHEIANFRSWLHSVCRNYCLMQLRKPQREINLNTDSPEFMESDWFVHLNDTEGISEDTLQALESALGTLNDKQRTCIDLFYMQQKSYEEISTITGLDIKEVKSHLQNGKRNLKIKMGDRGNLLGILVLLWIHNIA